MKCLAYTIERYVNHPAFMILLKLYSTLQSFIVSIKYFCIFFVISVSIDMPLKMYESLLYIIFRFSYIYHLILYLIIRKIKYLLVFKKISLNNSFSNFPFKIYRLPNANYQRGITFYQRSRGHPRHISYIWRRGGVMSSVVLRPSRWMFRSIN